MLSGINKVFKKMFFPFWLLAYKPSICRSVIHTNNILYIFVKKKNIFYIFIILDRTHRRDNKFEMSYFIFSKFRYLNLHLNIIDI